MRSINITDLLPGRAGRDQARKVRHVDGESHDRCQLGIGKAQAVNGSDAPAGRHLNIAHRHCQGWAVVELAGPLEWPSAVQLTEFMPFTARAILLDLTEVTSIDNTGIAFLASVTEQLKDAGHRVRVVVANAQLRRQLPRTAGLQDICVSMDEAIGSGIARPAQGS